MNIRKLVSTFTLLPFFLLGNDDNFLIHIRASAFSNGSCKLIWRPTDTPKAGNLFTVEALSENDVWAAGSGNFLHWDGTTWNVVAKPVAGDVRGMVAIATDDVWAFGFNADSNFILHWDGVAWSKSFNPNESVMGLVAFSENDVWAMGLANEYYHWNGVTWNTSAYGSPVPNATILGMDGAAANEMWAVGYTGTTPATTPIILRFDGNAWSEHHSLPTGPYSYLYAVRVVSADDVWAAGNLQVAVHWDGNAWSSVGLPNPYPVFRSLTAVAADDIYGVGSEIVHWDGESWQVVATPGILLNAVDAVSASDVWAVGRRSKIVHGTSIAQVRARAPKDNSELPEGKVSLRWQDQDCADYYKVVLRRDSPKGKKITRATVSENEFLTRPLQPNDDYYWRVRACDSVRCSDWSKWRSFHIVP